jgi:hypothetical protein
MSTINICKQESKTGETLARNMGMATLATSMHVSPDGTRKIVRLIKKDPTVVGLHLFVLLCAIVMPQGTITTIKEITP